MLNSGVYKIENLVTGKVYIGESSKIRSRINSHFMSMKKGYGPIPSEVLEDVKLYGVKSFSIEVIHFIEINKCRNLETFYIDLYDSANPDKGYNKAVYRNRVERVVKEKNVYTPYVLDPDERFLNFDQACEMLGITKKQLDELVRRGMPYLKIAKGRYQIKTLKEWKEKIDASV